MIGHLEGCVCVVGVEGAGERGDDGAASQRRRRRRRVMSTTPAKENGAAAVASNDGGVKTPNSVRAREENHDAR